MDEISNIHLTPHSTIWGARRFYARKGRFVFPRPTADPPVSYHWEIDKVRFLIANSSHSPSLELNFCHFHIFLHPASISYEEVYYEPAGSALLSFTLDEIYLLVSWMSTERNEEQAHLYCRWFLSLVQ